MRSLANDINDFYSERAKKGMRMGNIRDIQVNFPNWSQTQVAASLQSLELRGALTSKRLKSEKRKVYYWIAPLPNTRFRNTKLGMKKSTSIVVFRGQYRLIRTTEERRETIQGKLNELTRGLNNAVDALAEVGEKTSVINKYLNQLASLENEVFDIIEEMEPDDFPQLIQNNASVLEGNVVH